MAENDDEDVPIDTAEADDAVVDDYEEQPANEEEAAADLASETDNFGDETELPSETAVLAEIAAVQDELNVQNDIQDDLEPANNIPVNVVVERQSSTSHDSVDFHEDVTEVTSIPQIDGSIEVGVYETHVDGHEHIEHAPALEPAVGLVGSLFGGS